MSAPLVATARLLAPARVPRGPQSVAEAFRRNELARRQATKRKEKETRKYRKDYERDRRNERNTLLGLRTDQIKEARRIRKEDYDLGPLAPRRDVGDSEHTFGSADPRVSQDVDRPRWQQEWCPFKLGDRVVLLEGKDKGKIGVVDEISDGSQNIIVKDLNLVELAVPQWLREQGMDPAHTRVYPQSVPFESVRLVYPMPHPVTGHERDVIIENLERREDWYDETTNITHYKRVVPELGDYEIPWPPQEDPIYTDHDDDTLRISTEHITFEGQALPLLTLPMPPTVINELRNPHSKTSTRRLKDPAYLQKLQAREENNRQKTMEMLAAMRTPLQELHALRASQKKQATATVDTQADPKTFLDIKEGKPWSRKMTYDAKKAWQSKWEEEKTAAQDQGRKAKKPLKVPRHQEPLDAGFLEQLGAMMVEQGLNGTKKAARRAAAA